MDAAAVPLLGLKGALDGWQTSLKDGVKIGSSTPGPNRRMIPEGPRTPAPEEPFTPLVKTSQALVAEPPGLCYAPRRKRSGDFGSETVNLTLPALRRSLFLPVPLSGFPARPASSEVERPSAERPEAADRRSSSVFHMGFNRESPELAGHANALPAGSVVQRWKVER